MASDEATTQVLPKLVRFVFTLLWLKSVHLPTISCETVYFDKYGHCQRSWKPFDLDDDVYTLKSTGGNDAYNSMKCSMTFRAPSEYGICLTFKDVKITRCDVTIEIHNSKSDGNTEPAWRTLSCYEDVPSPMCTSNRYVTVTVSKTRFSHYDGYESEMEVEKSNSVSGDGVLFASIGIFVGIVLGVVVFIAILAGVVLYCCYLQNRQQTANSNQAGSSEKGAAQRSEDRGQQETLIEPSAPPVDEIYRPNEVTPVLAHDHQSSQDLPPPYVLPPPYEEEYSTSSAPPLQQENSGTSPMK